MLNKERIGPATMIEAVAASSTTMTMAEDAAQTHTDPTVQCQEREPTAVLKVLEPSFQSPIDAQDDDRKTMPIVPFSFLTDGVAEFSQAPSARPSLTLLKVISEKIESSRLRCVDDLCLFRMQSQSGFGRPLLHLF